MVPQLAAIIHLVFWLIYLLILASVVLSWLPLMNVRVPSYHPAVMFVRGATEPLLRPFRRLLPPSKTSGIDFSPLLLLLVVGLIQQLVLSLLRGS